MITLVQTFSLLRLIGKVILCNCVLLCINTIALFTDTETIYNMYMRNTWGHRTVNKSSKSGLHIEIHKHTDILAAWSQKENYGTILFYLCSSAREH